MKQSLGFLVVRDLRGPGRGIEFVRPPREEAYGTVAVFRDLYGNLWDLLGPPAGPTP